MTGYAVGRRRTLEAAVRYEVRAEDGHTISGGFSFTVLADAPTTTAAPATTVAPTTLVPSATPDEAPDYPSDVENCGGPGHLNGTTDQHRGVAALLGADHHLVVAPRLVAGDVPAERHVGRTILVEAIVLAFAVVMSAILTRSSIA